MTLFILQMEYELELEFIQIYLLRASSHDADIDTAQVVIHHHDKEIIPEPPILPLATFVHTLPSCDHTYFQFNLHNENKLLTKVAII